LDPGAVIVSGADNNAGILRLMVTQLNPSEAKSGTGIIMAVVFRGIQADAESDVVLDSVEFARRDGTAIEATPEDGLVLVRPEAPPGPTPTPIPLQLPGTPIPLLLTALPTSTARPIATATSLPTATPPPTQTPAPEATETATIVSPTAAATRTAPPPPAPTPTIAPTASAVDEAIDFEQTAVASNVADLSSERPAGADVEGPNGGTESGLAGPATDETRVTPAAVGADAELAQQTKNVNSEAQSPAADTSQTTIVLGVIAIILIFAGGGALLARRRWTN
jgi:hypothetical protein